MRAKPAHHIVIVSHVDVAHSSKTEARVKSNTKAAMRFEIAKQSQCIVNVVACICFLFVSALWQLVLSCFTRSCLVKQSRNQTIKC
jgi:hypothetical protein